MICMLAERQEECVPHLCCRAHAYGPILHLPYFWRQGEQPATPSSRKATDLRPSGQPWLSPAAPEASPSITHHEAPRCEPSVDGMAACLRMLAGVTLGSAIQPTAGFTDPAQRPLP